MGVKDNIITPYFEDSTVFCDFINGAVFKGKHRTVTKRIDHAASLGNGWQIKSKDLDKRYSETGIFSYNVRDLYL